MYHFPGEYVTDFCIVRHDGLYHLFHIRGERWTWPVGYREIDLGHATSTDLRTWTPHDPVLPAGPAGAWDEAGNWAPDIIEANGVYYCYYTGSDHNNNQAIGLATSRDLFHWEKHPHNPVVEPGPWSDRHVGRDVAGRDAMVFHDRDRNRHLMYYTATMRDGRACIALAESYDLLRWADLGPTYIEEDRTYNRLESAYLVPHGDTYYLFYSAKGGPKSKGFAPGDFAHFDIVYQISENPTQGWTKPANHLLIESTTCASEHPTFDGVTYMFYIVQEELEGVWGASVLSDPKRIEWLPDGTVCIREHLPDNVQTKVLFESRQRDFSGWVQHGGKWQVAGSELQVTPSAEDAFLMDTFWGADLTFEAEMRAETDGVASLVVRGNPSAFAGYRIGLDFGRGVVGFYLRFPGQDEVVLQERPVKLEAGAWHKLKVVVQWKFFEIYVDDALMIVHDQRVYEDGCFGLHARGAVQFRNIQAYTITEQVWKLPAWSRRCRPRHLFPASVVADPTHPG
jgi:beta-fructofuranosidase